MARARKPSRSKGKASSKTSKARARANAGKPSPKRRGEETKKPKGTPTPTRRRSVSPPLTSSAKTKKSNASKERKPKLSGRKARAFERGTEREALREERSKDLVTVFQDALSGSQIPESDIRKLFADAMAQDRAMRKRQREERKRIYERAESLTPYQRRLARGYIYGWSKEQARGKPREDEPAVSDLERSAHRQDRGRRRNLRAELFDKYGSVQAMADYFESIGLQRSEAYTLWWSP